MDLFNAITGGSAQVWIEYPRHVLKPGERISVRVTVMPRTHFQANGVYVDLMASERGLVNTGNECINCNRNFSRSQRNINNRMYYHSTPLTGPLQFWYNQVMVFEGTVTIPPNAQPTYLGSFRHEWEIRGRVDALGNDPDSGLQAIVVR